MKQAFAMLMGFALSILRLAWRVAPVALITSNILLIEHLPFAAQIPVLAGIVTLVIHRAKVASRGKTVAKTLAEKGGKAALKHKGKLALIASVAVCWLLTGSLVAPAWFAAGIIACRLWPKLPAVYQKSRELGLDVVYWARHIGLKRWYTGLPLITRRVYVGYLAIIPLASIYPVANVFLGKVFPYEYTIVLICSTLVTDFIYVLGLSLMTRKGGRLAVPGEKKWAWGQLANLALFIPIAPLLDVFNRSQQSGYHPSQATAEVYGAAWSGAGFVSMFLLTVFLHSLLDHKENSADSTPSSTQTTTGTSQWVRPWYAYSLVGVSSIVLYGTPVLVAWHVGMQGLPSFVGYSWGFALNFSFSWFGVGIGTLLPMFIRAWESQPSLRFLPRVKHTWRELPRGKGDEAKTFASKILRMGLIGNLTYLCGTPIVNVMLGAYHLPQADGSVITASMIAILSGSSTLIQAGIVGEEALARLRRSMREYRQTGVWPQ